MNKILSYYNDALLIKNGGLPVPRMAMIYPTYVCNFGCSHCMYRNMSRTQHYPYDKFTKLIGELAKFGVKGVVFCGGGEPTLYPGLEGIIKHIHKNRMEFGILTNGSMLDKYHKVLVDNSRFIRVTVDSIDKDNYSKIHNPPQNYTLFDTLDNIKTTLEYRNKSENRCMVGVKTLLSQNNILEQENIEYYFKKLGVDYVQFKYARDCPEEIEKEKSTLKCRCFMSPIQTMIDAYGDVYICCFYQYRIKSHKFGNVLHDSFVKVWNSPEHKKALKKIRIDECNIYDCKLHEYNNLMDDILVRDPYHINFF